MPKTQLIINTDHPEECRAAILEDGKLEEYIVEHSSQELLKGNVYLGVITRVEPAIEAAFVDYGGKKYGFLPFKDVHPDSYRPTGEKKARVRIQDVLFAGQKILVQVIKEERETKGPTLTNFVTIPGRYLVLMFGSDSTGVSRKIENEEERKSLKEILSALEVPQNMGVIARTAGVGRSKVELQKDFQMLHKIWDTIKSAEAASRHAPALLYRGPDMVVRTVRDHFTNETEEIIIDTGEAFKKVQEFFNFVMPKMLNRLKQYQGGKPIFSYFRIEEQIEGIYDRKVPLASGGSLVIDAGEALVSIDVNSGKTTSASQLEETALRTNMEAANEIARQLRLRDLGGLIVIDFIDMFSKKNKANVEKQLRVALKKDKARVNLSRISRFGLLEMSRQRMAPPIKEGAFDRCQSCRGAGFIRSRSSAGVGVLRRIQEMLAPGNVSALEATVSPEIAGYLLNNKSRFILDLQENQKVRILFSTKPNLVYDEFSYTVLEKRKGVEIPTQILEAAEPAVEEGETAGQETVAREPEFMPYAAESSPTESLGQATPEGAPPAEATAAPGAFQEKLQSDGRRGGRHRSRGGRSSRGGHRKHGGQRRPRHEGRRGHRRGPPRREEAPPSQETASTPVVSDWINDSSLSTSAPSAGRENGDRPDNDQGRSEDRGAFLRPDDPPPAY